MARITLRNMSRALVVLAVPSILLSGGFSLTTYSGQAPIAAKIPGAVVLIAAEGCHNPAEAQLVASAEGLVGGKRQSVALKLIPTSRPGTYAVTREWPSEGIWVLNVKATYLGNTTGGLLEIGRDSKPGKISSKRFGQTVPDAEIAAALQRLAGT